MSREEVEARGLRVERARTLSRGSMGSIHKASQLRRSITGHTLCWHTQEENTAKVPVPVFSPSFLQACSFSTAAMQYTGQIRELAVLAVPCIAPWPW